MEPQDEVKAQLPESLIWSAEGFYGGSPVDTAMGMPPGENGTAGISIHSQDAISLPTMRCQLTSIIPGHAAI